MTRKVLLTGIVFWLIVAGDPGRAAAERSAHDLEQDLALLNEQLGGGYSTAGAIRSGGLGDGPWSC